MRSLFAFVLPEQASDYAAQHDAVFWFITLSGIIMSILVGIVVAFFAIRYRRGNRVNRRLPEHEGVALELTWTIIPLLIFLVMFGWSVSVYYTMIRVPKDAMEVYVVGKQWMWKLQQPNGRWEMNELHVPVGKAVKLTMISEDVIHDFYVPAFRIKMDVVPGRYTHLWFRPTKPGRYHIFCSQYCGTNHAIMGGYVTVMEAADYEKWSKTGSQPAAIASAGERKFRELGCTGCHGENASVRAPSLANIYGKPVAIVDENGQTRTIKADDRYIHDSIVLPEKEIVAGYDPIMPSYKGRVSEEELVQLLEYIKSLGNSNGSSNGLARAYDVGGETARVGGTTPNVDTMAKSSGRERVLAGREQGAARPELVPMHKSTARESVFRGKGDRTAATGTIDESAGGSRPYISERGGPKVYTTPGYTKAASRAYSGLTASDKAYNRAVPRSSAQPSLPSAVDAASNREQERTGQ